MSPIEFRMLMEGILPFVIALAGIGAGGKIITAWIKSRGGGGAANDKALREISEQLHQLQQSVDTMAIEVERIEESQRFNARLLAEGRPEFRSGPKA
jgi:hypothetical protein